MQLCLDSLIIVKARLPMLLLLLLLPSSATNESPAVTLDAPLMLVPEPTEIVMIPLELDADKPLPIPKAPLAPTLAVQVFKERSPNTPAVPALLINTAMLPKLVAVPAPDKMVMEPPKAILPLLPLIIKGPLLVLLSTKARGSSCCCWSMRIQKQLMHLLQLLLTTECPSNVGAGAH
jgi:hypothetical protein